MITGKREFKSGQFLRSPAAGEAVERFLAALRGRAHVHLADWEYFLVARIVDLLLAEPPYAASTRLTREQRPAALTLHRARHSADPTVPAPRADPRRRDWFGADLLAAMARRLAERSPTTARSGRSSPQPHYAIPSRDARPAGPSGERCDRSGLTRIPSERIPCYAGMI